MLFSSFFKDDTYRVILAPLIVRKVIGSKAGVDSKLSSLIEYIIYLKNQE